MLSGKHILLGVTGGIAAYKAAFLLRKLQKDGAVVRVVMTPDATRFVGKKTFASLSKNSVAVDIFPENNNNSNSWTRHIHWGEWADLFVIAPCTANSLGKIANGLADNMLTATFTAARCPVLVCPTMDGEMYDSPAIQNNISTLQSTGSHILQPGEGYLASGLKGRGRLPKLSDIERKCETILDDSPKPLSGKKVVVTAGPTREYIDPVRFLSNPSSGKMGFAMARTAQKLGGNVTLLHGSVSLEIPAGMTTKEFGSTEDLLHLMQNESDADIIIMAAAVSDFTPKKQYDQKIKKKNNLNEISLQRTPDILNQIAQNRRPDQLIIGFAMETEDLLENAAQKRTDKNIDWIIANSINDSNSGFSVDTNTVQLMGEDQKKEFSGLKTEIAESIFNYLF